MAKITWTVEALRRLREIHDYIAEENPQSASKVVSGIYAKVQLLRTFPELGQRYEPITDRHVREIIFGNYRIPYLLSDDTSILVLGVFHCAMDIDAYLQ
ncbi:MAG: type II toxin-antitoxin system RelE/ParE family toxin [Pirellulaceae bacterium]